MGSEPLGSTEAVLQFAERVLPGGGATSIAAADVDGDGDLDVLLGNDGSPNRVLLNAGGGTFPTSITLPGGSARTRSIAAADVDGDGDLDVLLGNEGGPSRVLLNAGDGVSWTNITLPDGGGLCTETCTSSSDGVCDDGGSNSESSSCYLGTDCTDCGPRSRTYSIAAADVNGDGDLDVLLGNSDGPSQVLLNAGGGTFPMSIELPGGSAFTYSIAAADVDGDGDLDVLLGNHNSPSRVLLNAGGGTFPTSIALPGGSAFTYSIAAADVDGDGDVDVLLGNFNSPSRVLHNAGGGTFPTSIALPGGENTFSIAAADVDGDGDLDVLLGGRPNSVLLNAGGGTFPTSITLPGSANSGSANSIVAADVDGDGDLDVLSGDYSSPSVLLNALAADSFPTSIALPNSSSTCTETCTSSSDGVCDDGGSNSESSSCYLGTDCTDCGPRSTTYSIAAADVDGDGDLDVLLGNYDYGGPSRVLLNAGDGTFPTSIELPGGSAFTYSIAAADVDGDGDLDVLLGNSKSPSRVLLNAGDGVSWTYITLPDGGICTETCESSSNGICDDGWKDGGNGWSFSCELPGTDCADCGPRSFDTRSIAAADVDGDGDLDVLLGNYGSSPSRVLLNAGGGSFMTSMELPGGSARTHSIAAADVDGDGDLDVLLGNEMSPSRVLLNAGGGTSWTSISLPGVCTETCTSSSDGVCDDGHGGPSGLCVWGTDCADCGPRIFDTHSIAAADVDGDGDLDVLLGNYDYGSTKPSQVLLNAGGGTFPTSITLPGGSARTRSIAAADVDGNGDLDVLLGNEGGPSRVLLNAGGGTFPTSIDLPGGSAYTYSIAAADVDGDGDLDVLLGNSGTPSRVLPFIRCSDPGSARSRYGNGCVRCPSPSSRRDDVSDVCYECEEHSQLDATGACVACTEGSERVFGAPRCTRCPAGKRQAATGTACIPCIPGEYVKFQGLFDPEGCLPCLPGSFNPTSGATRCTPCAPATYSSNLGASACSACPPGGFCPVAGAAALSLTFLPCPAGTYNPDMGASTNTSCLSCPAGTANPVPQSTAASACKACLPGSYAAQNGTSICDLCPAGTFTSMSGSTTCRPCTPGYLCIEGSSAPQPCPGGTHANQTVLNLTGYLGSLSECIDCPVGTSCSVGSAVAVPCAPGTYNNQSRQETCVKCAAGSFQNRTGQTSCSPCTPGYYCAEGAAAALPCPGGTHKNASLSVMKSVDQCVVCPVGTSCSVGSAVAVPCAPGTYNNQSQQETCLKCAPGSFQELPGQTSCIPCTPGYYCAEGAAAALPCPGGTHKNASLSVMRSVDQCVVCPVGTSCSVGSAMAVPCAPGTYNNRSGQETCLKCAAGSFQNRTGQTSCSPCTAGYYCAEGAATPVPCPGGKYNNRTGLESEAGCVPVGFGFWAPTGSVFPIPCPSGFSCPGYFNDFNTSGSQPLILPTGGLTPLETVETQTIETVTGSLSLNAPLSSFLSNASRQIQYRQTIAAQLGVRWQDLQLDFSAASLSPPAAGRRLQTSSTIVTYTIVRTVTTNPTTSNATSNVTTSGPPIVAPSFALNSLDPAVLGVALGVSVAALVAPTATVVQQTVTVIRERVCPRGFWCTAGLEVACEQGFYNPTTNAASQTACLRCPDRSTTNGTAATNVSECVCQASFVRQLDAAGNPQCVCAAGRELVGGVRCDACKTGTYKDWTGENADRNPLGPQKCLDCPVAGTTTVHEGADSVVKCVCKANTFASLTRAEMMRATNDSSRVAAGAFECVPCMSIHSGPGEMTNCTAPGVTLDTIPVMPGHWRQNPRALYVRKCDLEEACLGAELAGDVSCADGHTGPLCDLCVKDPLHFGGRGSPCQSCSDAGNPMETITFYIIGGVVVLLAVVLATAICKRRGAKVPAVPKKEEEAGVEKYQGAKHLAQKAVTEGVVKGMLQEAAGTDTMTEANKVTTLAAAGATFASVMSSLGVKIRILISLIQVVSQLDVIFDITYPAFYTAILEGLKNINIQVNLLPFGCVLPLLDNFIFDLVLKTATPIILVLLLSFASTVLRACSATFLADACSDLWFFIIFLVYPSCSSMTFMFFMRETYDQPGEVHVDLMRADRSIDREGTVYQGFTVYAVVMLILYPIGVPLFYGLIFHHERHQLQEMRRIELARETDFALAKLEADAAATPCREGCDGTQGRGSARGNR